MICKRFCFLALMQLASVTLFAQNSAQNAADIVEKSRNRIKAETTQTRSRMVLTAKNGSVSERLMDQYSKDDERGNARSVVIFQSPATVAGTRFLTMENSARANDLWIFLPGPGRVRRLAASEGSGSFVGSDLSYDDVSSMSRKTDLDTHRLLREEKYLNRDCYVIESIPKDSAYQYSKMILWIDKENFVNQKIELYDKRGNQVKIFEILELREVQGRLSPIVSRMSTLADGTSTTINVEIIRYNEQIPESVFTTAFLETGRP